MKHILLLLVFVSAQSARGEDFTRNLPSKGLLDQLTPEKFKNEDAVVILKEQSFRVDPFVRYQGEKIEASTTSYSKILIVKLFDESAVARYGSVEVVYPIWGKIEPRNGGFVHARVLKPDGAVHAMPASDVKEIVSRQDVDGEPLEGKVVAKIPDLAVGDVVQIETTVTICFARDYSGIFYYNERDPILFSNLYVTLTLTEKPTFSSFPEQQIGKPQETELAEELGSGTTYFWSLKNLPAIHKELLAPTFEDQSWMTAFVVSKRAANGFIIDANWTETAKRFYHSYLDQDNVSTSNIQTLGFASDRSLVTLRTVDSLYAAIRKDFRLEEHNSIYPLSEHVDKLFSTKKGDASDCSYIFYNILRHSWKQIAQAVWIRDRREGGFERSVPTRHWFDRLGVLVTVGNKQRLYDFDRCVAERYQMPWYLNGITVVVLGEDGCEFKEIGGEEQAVTGLTRERHIFRFNSDLTIQDSMLYSCSGTEAQQQRELLYTADQDRIHESLRTMVLKHCLQSVDTLTLSRPMQEEPIVFSCRGGSKSKADHVDSFAVFKVKSHALKNFREKIFSTTRHADLMFEEPTTIAAEWIIPIPPGFTLSSRCQEKETSANGGISGRIARSQTGNKLHIEAEVSFPQIGVPPDQYPAVLKFLDAIITDLESDIVLKKHM